MYILCQLSFRGDAMGMIPTAKTGIMRIIFITVQVHLDDESQDNKQIIAGVWGTQRTTTNTLIVFLNCKKY